MSKYELDDNMVRECLRNAADSLPGYLAQALSGHPEPELPNVAGALDIAAECARYDGDHHKQWVFDQMVRNLTGCPVVDMVNESAVNGPYHYKGLGESEAYREFRAANPRWTEGIAP